MGDCHTGDRLRRCSGGVVDADFGPMVMVGLGGIFVEILRDVAFRICPIRRDEAQDMVAGLRGSALLRGARGRVAPPSGGLTA